MGADVTALPPSLRTLLELDLKRLADEGHIPAVGEREVRFRVDAGGHVRWFESSTIRTPASELEPASSGLRRRQVPWQRR